MYHDLKAHETEVRGEWHKSGSQVVESAACERIRWLTNSQLERIASAPGGWDTLYLDPKTDRFWELTYPDGDYHGGGPPMLRTIAPAEVLAKYDNSVD